MVLLTFIYSTQGEGPKDDFLLAVCLANLGAEPVEGRPVLAPPVQDAARRLLSCFRSSQRVIKTAATGPMMIAAIVTMPVTLIDYKPRFILNFALTGPVGVSMR